MQISCQIKIPRSPKLGHYRIVFVDIILDGKEHRDLEFRFPREEAKLIAEWIMEAVALKHDYLRIVSGSRPC